MAQFELTEIGLLVLSLLTTRTHGYDIMKTIDNDLEGEVRIGPATLYTTLSKLVASGLCLFEQEGAKKLYRITNKGYDVLIHEFDKKRFVLDYIGERLQQNEN
jgi:DNA-binding PadR family transcriptional regulator